MDNHLKIPIISVNGKVVVVGTHVAPGVIQYRPIRETIIKVVSDAFGVQDTWFFIRSRKREFSTPRMLYSHMMFRFTRMNLMQIGFSYPVEYNHSTIIHHINTSVNLFETEKEYADKTKYIDKTLRSLGLVAVRKTLEKASMYKHEKFIEEV